MEILFLYKKEGIDTIKGNFWGCPIREVPGTWLLEAISFLVQLWSFQTFPSELSAFQLT